MTSGQQRWLRRLPAAVVAVALVVLVVRNADTPDLPDYEVPEGFTPAPPPTTSPPGAALPALAAVDGTTTTSVPPNVGRARLAGTVTGPQGAVAGATVRLERVVGGASQVVDVVTGADGRYDAAGIGGGRYRVRAFLPPTLAQATGEVLFLRDGEERGLDLAVDGYGSPSVAVAYAPEAPMLDDPVGVAVRVSGRIVDADGVVRTQPVAGATVDVSATGGLAPATPAPRVTGGDGRTSFAFTCRSESSSTVQVSARLPAAIPGTAPATATLDVPGCIDPTTLTTTTTTSTTTPSASSSTSTTAG